MVECHVKVRNNNNIRTAMPCLKGSLFDRRLTINLSFLVKFGFCPCNFSVLSLHSLADHAHWLETKAFMQQVFAHTEGLDVS